MILQNCRPLQGGNYFLGFSGCSTQPSGARRSDSWGFEWFLTEGKGNKLDSRNPPLPGMLLWLQLCKRACTCARTCTVCAHASLCAHMWVHERVCICVLCTCVQCMCVCTWACVDVCTYMPTRLLLSPTHTYKAQWSLCRNVSREETLSSKSTELKARKPNLEHILSKFFLLPVLPPWTSSQTFPSLFPHHKLGVTILAPLLWGPNEIRYVRILCKAKHIVKTLF